MATNIEWGIAHTLVTEYGELPINVPDVDTGRVYRIQPESYKIVPSLRVTEDNITQADGSVLHPRWKTGLVATMQVGFDIQLGADVADMVPACGADLREMNELLDLHLNSIRDYSGGTDQRLRWQPTGYGDQRMLTEILLLQWGDPSYDLNGVEALVAFSVETPFPYGIDATEIDPATIDAGDSAVLANAGNSPVYPVFKLHGPVTINTVISNDTTGYEIAYNPALVGAVNIPSGHYCEINTFRGTAYKDGSGDNLIAGIDPRFTDFAPLFNLMPGDNTISLDGEGSLDVLYNNAWC